MLLADKFHRALNIELLQQVSIAWNCAARLERASRANIARRVLQAAALAERSHALYCEDLTRRCFSHWLQDWTREHNHRKSVLHKQNLARNWTVSKVASYPRMMPMQISSQTSCVLKEMPNSLAHVSELGPLMSTAKSWNEPKRPMQTRFCS
eukprot:gb/GFBE01029638.1/.p1 GENE.gb/GFBE01029638.1/~~gb/GFBE01029638.1/.p1  ORF type:complete len:152 (+),score=8.98 gb/GFBE01029638.1/:1-456(+)